MPRQVTIIVEPMARPKQQCNTPIFPISLVYRQSPSPPPSSPPPPNPNISFSSHGCGLAYDPMITCPWLSFQPPPYLTTIHLTLVSSTHQYPVIPTVPDHDYSWSRAAAPLTLPGGSPKVSRVRIPLSRPSLPPNPPTSKTCMFDIAELKVCRNQVRHQTGHRDAMEMSESGRVSDYAFRDLLACSIVLGHG